VSKGKKFGSYGGNNILKGAVEEKGEDIKGKKKKKRTGEREHRG